MDRAGRVLDQLPQRQGGDVAGDAGTPRQCGGQTDLPRVRHGWKRVDAGPQGDQLSGGHPGPDGPGADMFLQRRCGDPPGFAHECSDVPRHDTRLPGVAGQSGGSWRSVEEGSQRCARDGRKWPQSCRLAHTVPCVESPGLARRGVGQPRGELPDATIRLAAGAGCGQCLRRVAQPTRRFVGVSARRRRMRVAASRRCRTLAGGRTTSPSTAASAGAVDRHDQGAP